jgi:hypothetical protein
MEEVKVKKLCKRCHRELKNPKSVEIGLGPTCLKRVKAEHSQKPLFNSKR